MFTVMAAPPAAIAVGMDLQIALFTLVDEAGGSIFDEILSNGQPRVSGKKIPKKRAANHIVLWFSISVSGRLMWTTRSRWYAADPLEPYLIGS